MTINLELYKTFYYVAKELSFSKAAKTLFLSQSAVSQSILQLEKELGTKLFIRTTKKVSLTLEGETLFRHIEPAIHSIMQGEKKLSEIANLERGRLHIGVSDTICKYYLIPYLQRFHETYPNIEILITNRTSIECVDLLKRNMVDLIISNLPNHALTLEMTVLETESFHDIFIAPKKYYPDLNQTVTFSQLCDYPMLMLGKQSSTTHYLLEAFQKRNLTLRPSIELGSIDLLVDMTKIGLGITCIPDYVYQEDEHLFIINTKEKLALRKLGIITQAKTPLSTAAKTFIHSIIHYKSSPQPY